jgi:hypothetical protein
MTRQPFDRQLRAFVADVPESAPRDLLESILIDLPTVKQRRRRFGVGRRFQTMTSPLRAVAFVAAALVVAFAGFSMLRQPTGPGGQPAVTPMPTPTATSTPTTAAPTPSPSPLSSPRITGATVTQEGTVLDPGTTYVLTSFEPPFTFVGIADMFVGRDRPDHAFVIHATSEKINAGVVRPGTVFSETGAATAVPENLVAWVQARTDLTILSSTPVALGSADGTLIEASVADDANQNAGAAVNVFCPGTLGCNFESGGSIGWARGDRVLVLVTSIGGEPVAAIGTAAEADWTDYGPAFEAWLRSFDFPG